MVGAKVGAKFCGKSAVAEKKPPYRRLSFEGALIGRQTEASAQAVQTLSCVITGGSTPELRHEVHEEKIPLRQVAPTLVALMNLPKPDFMELDAVPAIMHAGAFA